jgi:trans-2,3-dihydro-3-hydroxyanthranilate isomerase
MHARYLTADVFTDHLFGGNQLAVFPDAAEIPPDLMLPITREFNYSETTFALPPERKGSTYRLRIFTPGGEVPFAGHPTVGSAHVLAAIGAIELTGDETQIVFDEGVGPVPVMIRTHDGRPTFTQLSVAKLPEVGAPPPSNAELAAILSLDTGDIMTGDMAPASISCGLPFLIVPVQNLDAVRRARVRLDRWEATLTHAWARDIYVVARGGERPGTQLHARMFGPGVAVAEDPATGSAAATLAGYLALRDEQREGTLRWVVEQGFEMGRPSIIEIEADKKADAITAVRVGGSTVVVCEGRIELP